MIDKEKFKKAQEWADQAFEIAGYSPTMPERAKAAAEVIKSLPDTIVNGEELREWRDKHKGNISDNGLDDLEALLPAPPAPRTMADIEWDDTKHRFAGAETENGYELVMMERRWVEGHPDLYVILCVDLEGRVDTWVPGLITPTGKRFRLEPTRSVPKGGPIEQDFDPAYAYRDKDGDEWECLDGRWVTGDTHARRVDTREESIGLATLPDRWGPYTRIEKEAK